MTSYLFGTINDLEMGRVDVFCGMKLKVLLTDVFFKSTGNYMAMFVAKCVIYAIPNKKAHRSVFISGRFA